MAARLVKSSGAALRETASIPASTTISNGAILALDASNNGLIPATSSSTTLTVRAVAQEALTSIASVQQIDVLYTEWGQIWEMDCTNNTATNQLFKRHALTNSLTVNNSSSEATTTAGGVEMIKIIGSASDKKAWFRIVNTVIAA